jgi:hypothetical protein
VTILDVYGFPSDHDKYGPSQSAGGSDLNKIIGTSNSGTRGEIADMTMDMWRNDPVFKDYYHEVGEVSKNNLRQDPFLMQYSSPRQGNPNISRNFDSHTKPSSSIRSRPKKSNGSRRESRLSSVVHTSRTPTLRDGKESGTSRRDGVLRMMRWIRSGGS